MIPSPYGQNLTASEKMDKIKAFIENLGYKDYIITVSAESGMIKDEVFVETAMHCTPNTAVSLMQVIFNEFEDIL